METFLAYYQLCFVLYSDVGHYSLMNVFMLCIECVFTYNNNCLVAVVKILINLYLN